MREYLKFYVGGQWTDPAIKGILGYSPDGE